MKKIIIVTLALVMSLSLVACNKQVVDTNYNFDEAIIALPDGRVIKGECESWRDYEDGDQIQVKVDGEVYLVHSSNVVLIRN